MARCNGQPVDAELIKRSHYRSKCVALECCVQILFHAEFSAATASKYPLSQQFCTGEPCRHVFNRHKKGPLGMVDVNVLYHSFLGWQGNTFLGGHVRNDDYSSKRIAVAKSAQWHF